MKALILTLSLIYEIGGNAQYKFNVKKELPTMISLFVAGAADGTGDFLQYHYDGNNDFLNPDLSWKRKWKNGNPNEGERFPGSSTIFVGFTDAWHLCKVIRNAGFISAVTFKISLNEKKKFKYYLLDALIYYAVHKAGFAATYYTLKQ